MKAICVLLVSALWPVVVSSQVSISPESLDFGEIGTSVVRQIPYERVIEVRNATAEPLLVRPRQVTPRSTNGVYKADVSWSRGLFTFYGGAFRDTGTRRVEPGTTVFVLYRLNVQGWGMVPFGEYRDTVIVGVRPVGAAESEEVRYGVPVQADIAEMKEPLFVLPQGVRAAQCRCRFDPQRAGTADLLGLYIVNPLGSRDTITVDSFAVVPLEGSIARGFFKDFLYKYDSVGDAAGGKPRFIPGKILPGMVGWLHADVPWIEGNHRSLVRVYLQDGRVLQDTLKALVEGHGEPLTFGSAQEAWVVGPTVDTARGFSRATYAKCGVPDSVPLWLDRTYFTGPNVEALELHPLSGSGGGGMLELPARVECGETVGYDVWVYRDRAREGETIDTLWAEYHYDDPERGRVDVVSARLVRVYVYPRAAGVAGDGRGEKTAGVLEAIPNPARDKLRVLWRSYGNGQGIGVRLYDLLGRDALRAMIPFDPSGGAEIDLSTIPHGTYRVAVQGTGGRILAVGSVVILE